MKKIILTILVCLAIGIKAEIRYVSKTGSSTPPYTSWISACDSIQKCINYSHPGDTIYVGNGTYTEKIMMTEGLSLIGLSRDSTIIDDRPISGPGFICVTLVSNCRFENFKVIVSNSYFGHAIYGIYADVGAQNCFIGNNIVTMAYTAIDLGIFKNITVRNNIINNSGFGIRFESSRNEDTAYINNNYLSQIRSVGIYQELSTTAFVNDNIVLLNNGNIGEGFESGSQYFSFNNNIIYSPGDNLSGIYLGWPDPPYNGKCFNNIIAGNYTEYAFWADKGMMVFNNIIMNSGRGVRLDNHHNYPNNFRYNDVWNCSIPYLTIVPDTTNISVDPMIADENYSRFDAHLQKYSPLIDAGDPNYKDKDGSRSDMGAYGGPGGQSYAYLDLAPKAPRGITFSYHRIVLSINWTRNTETDINRYNIYSDTVQGFQPDSTRLIQTTTDTTYFKKIPYSNSPVYYKLTAIDNQGNESAASDEITVNLTGVNEPKITLQDYALYDAYPNPFNPSTTIEYRLSKRGYVKLHVYDIQGQLIKVLVNEVKEPGTYSVNFTASNQRGNDLASGIYIYSLQINNNNSIPVFNSMKKMILVK